MPGGARRCSADEKPSWQYLTFVADPATMSPATWRFWRVVFPPSASPWRSLSVIEKLIRAGGEEKRLSDQPLKGFRQDSQPNPWNRFRA